MNKIGTYDDFKFFAKDKCKVNEEALGHSMIKNFVYPTIIEEREHAMRITEMNVFSKLIQDRIVFLSGDVDTTSMDTIVAQLLYLDSTDKKDISIYINSGGGECYAGQELVSVMDFIKSDVSTTVLGLAASMGAVIASSGAKGKRYALPYSRFMIHQPIHSIGYSKYTDSKIELQELESVRNDLYEVLARNSGKDVKEVIEMCEHGDNWMKSEQAVEHKFIDAIIRRK